MPAPCKHMLPNMGTVLHAAWWNCCPPAAYVTHPHMTSRAAFSQATLGSNYNKCDLDYTLVPRDMPTALPRKDTAHAHVGSSNSSNAKACGARSSPRPSALGIQEHPSMRCMWHLQSHKPGLPLLSSVLLHRPTCDLLPVTCSHSACPAPAGPSRNPPDAPAASAAAASVPGSAPGAQPQRTPPSGPPPGEQPQYPPSFYEVMEMVSQGITPPNVRVGVGGCGVLAKPVPV